MKPETCQEIYLVEKRLFLKKREEARFRGKKGWKFCLMDNILFVVLHIKEHSFLAENIFFTFGKVDIHSQKESLVDPRGFDTVYILPK